MFFKILNIVAILYVFYNKSSSGVIEHATMIKHALIVFAFVCPSAPQRSLLVLAALTYDRFEGIATFRSAFDRFPKIQLGVASGYGICTQGFIRWTYLREFVGIVGLIVVLFRLIICQVIITNAY